MIKENTLLTAVVLAVLASSPAFAHGDEEHPAKTEPVVVSVVATLPQALAVAEASLHLLPGLIDGGKFDVIHEEVEKIESAAQTIKAKAGLEADKKLRLDAATDQFLSQLNKLHAASDAKDTEASLAQLKKVDAAWTLVENAMK